MSDIFDLDDTNCAPQLYDNISALRPSAPWLNELNPEQRQAFAGAFGRRNRQNQGFNNPLGLYFDYAESSAVELSGCDLYQPCR